jgi:peptidoglycan/xylan/chitin deacetylase (PgdA/CDA1 family)
LDISFETYKIEDYINITFHIEDTLSKIKNKNLLINLKDNKISYITALYDKEYLENEINKLVYNKYETNIYNKIINENINNFTYIINDDEIEVYFNNIKWDDFIPYVTIDLNESTSYISSNNGVKYIAFTYDDGPSEYSEELLDLLNKNNSSATFFIIGNNIKGREDIINKIYKSSSEVGSHGYSHSNFNKLTKEELDAEINTTNILFYNITNDYIKLVRPPYGAYNENLINSKYNIILWNIDSKDWLLKDSEKIYNNVIKNACDGCIVLMHDIYPETIEATKLLIPELNNIGYKIVSVSRLMEIKGYNSKYNNPISYIK